MHSSDGNGKSWADDGNGRYGHEGRLEMVDAEDDADTYGGEAKKMKKLLIGTLLLSFALLFPLPTAAGVDVSISLPPLIVFSAPPAMVVIPETYVYVVPDVREEIFFYDGWWWRPWEGRWYRSRHYDSGWGYYQRAPSFYRSVPSGWRNDYREHRWGGRPWNYRPVPHREVERNWSNWKKNRHWERQQTWGVQGLKPRSQSKQSSHKAQPKAQAQPRHREVQPRQSPPQHREVQPKQSQPRHREAAPRQSNPHQGKSGKAQGKAGKGHGKPGRGEEDKRNGR